MEKKINMKEEVRKETKELRKQFLGYNISYEDHRKKEPLNVFDSLEDREEAKRKGKIKLPLKNKEV